jgi:hypothetical protein
VSTVWLITNSLIYFLAIFYVTVPDSQVCHVELRVSTKLIIFRFHLQTVTALVPYKYFVIGTLKIIINIEIVTAVAL